MIDPYFLTISLLGAALAFLFAYAVREVPFFSIDTDTEKQARVASEIAKWRWPSDMHKSEFARTKTFMKDAAILLLAIFQKITKDSKTDYTLLVLSAFANALVTVLIYLVASFYWDQLTALFASLLFLSSLWMWQIALIGGHVTLAMALFLFSVLCLQQASISGYGASLIWTAVSGFAYGVTQFTSASSRKFTGLYMGALVSAFSPYLFHAGTLTAFGNRVAEALLSPVTFLLTAAALLFIVLLRVSYRPLVAAMYAGRAWGFLSRIIHARDRFSLEHYLDHARAQAVEVNKKIITFLIFALVLLHSLTIVPLFALVSGFACAVLIFLLPNLKTNFTHYFNYYYLPKGSKNRFHLYNNYFRGIAKPIPFMSAGAALARAGWNWIVKLLWRIIPFHLALFIAAALFLIFTDFRAAAPAYSLFMTLLLAGLSLSPLAWGELTKGPQIARSYSPGLLGALLLIGAAAFQAQNSFPYFWTIAFALTGASALWALRILVRDVYPARMATRTLVRALRARGIKKFATYETNYNCCFVRNIPPHEKFEITSLKSLRELTQGYAVIPGTSHKALTMESDWEGIGEGDYTKDPALNDLLNTGKIASIADECFFTMGSSRIWVHESEITSYRDMILHEISDKDRFRALGWLIDARKLLPALNQDRNYSVIPRCEGNADF